MKELTITQKKLVEVVQSNPGLTSADIANISGILMKTVTNNLTLLINGELLKREMISNKFRYTVIDVVSKKNKRPGIGKYVYHLLETTELTNREILEKVKEEFPEGNTTLACIVWYRSDLKRSNA